MKLPSCALGCRFVFCVSGKATSLQRRKINTVCPMYPGIYPALPPKFSSWSHFYNTFSPSPSPCMFLCLSLPLFLLSGSLSLWLCAWLAGEAMSLCPKHVSVRSGTTNCVKCVPLSVCVWVYAPLWVLKCMTTRTLMSCSPPFWPSLLPLSKSASLQVLACYTTHS